jgi:hypothetical protein
MLHHQRGLSLLWVAIFMAALASLAMLALFSMRYDRNLAAEGWARLMHGSGSAATIKKSQQAVETAKSALTGQPKPDVGGVRKCIINGKVLYSNTPCPNNATSHKVELHDTQGFEAPKKPPEPKDEATSATPQQKALDDAIEKSTR